MDLNEQLFELKMQALNAQMDMNDSLQNVAAQISGYRKSLLETGMCEMAVDQLCIHFGAKMQEAIFSRG